MKDSSDVVDVFESLFTCKFNGPGKLGRSQLSKVVMEKSSDVKEFQECAKGMPGVWFVTIIILE